MTKNNYIEYKTDHLKYLSTCIGKELGKILENIRLILLLSTDDIEQVLSMSANTIKNIEKGENVGVHLCFELISFYGYTHEELVKIRKLPRREELIERMKIFHEKHNSNTYKLVYENPSLLLLIQLEMLDTDIFDDWINQKTFLIKCKERFGFTYKNATSALNNSVKKGWLLSDDSQSPKKYIKKIK